MSDLKDEKGNEGKEMKRELKRQNCCQMREERDDGRTGGGG